MITPEPFAPDRLPESQIRWVEMLIKQYTAVYEALSTEERALIALAWNHMARRQSPATTPQFVSINQHPFVIQKLMVDLDHRKALWYDEDLRAVLQCAPFSVLHTPHHVKVFGWERAYVCSLLDIPATLLIYGPNVWLEAQTVCPRSGEILAFRVQLNEDYALRYELPSSASTWQVWLPIPAEPAAEVFEEFHRLRSSISAFYSAQDLDTHRQYQNSGPGVVYSLEQALYLSSLLLPIYGLVLKN